MTERITEAKRLTKEIRQDKARISRNTRKRRQVMLEANRVDRVTYLQLAEAIGVWPSYIQRELRQAKAEQ